MRSINKAILVPLLAAIATFIKQAFGYEVPDEWINTGADIVLFLLMVVGLFISPKKSEPKKKETTDHAEYPAADDAV